MMLSSDGLSENPHREIGHQVAAKSTAKARPPTDRQRAGQKRQRPWASVTPAMQAIDESCELLLGVLHLP